MAHTFDEKDLQRRLDLCDNEEYKKIPSVCKNLVACIRNHQNYAHYQMSNRSGCPTVCPLYTAPKLALVNGVAVEIWD